MNNNTILVLVIILGIVLIASVTVIRNGMNDHSPENNITTLSNAALSSVDNTSQPSANPPDDYAIIPEDADTPASNIAYVPVNVNTVAANAYGLTLTETNTSYIITNPGYYIAVIPKANRPAGGMIKELYIYNGNGYSQDVLYAGVTPQYGLGFIEGNSVKGSNGNVGMAYDTVNKTIDIFQNKSTIIFSSHGNTKGLQYNLTWEFTVGQPYFKSIMYANETNPAGRLVNQYQFCNMLNNTNVDWYSTDSTGNLKLVADDSFQHFNNGNLGSFPVFNAQFRNEGVSLGWVTTNVKYPLQVDFNTGDWHFELQYNFYGQIGSTNAIWVEPGMERKMTLYYYTANSISTVPIQDFANNLWMNTPQRSYYMMNLIHGGVYKNMFYQPSGLNAELYNSFIHIGNNNFNAYLKTNPLNNFTFPESWIRVYAPFFGAQEVYYSLEQPFLESATGDIEGFYNGVPSGMDNITAYGISSAYGVGKKLDFRFHINSMNYDLNFSVWNDSDKMVIEGKSGTNAYLNYYLDNPSRYYEAQDIAYTDTGYSLNNPVAAASNARGRNVMVFNNIPASKLYYQIPGLDDGKYFVWGYLKATNISGSYTFSHDGQYWFNINQNTGSNAQTVHELTYLGQGNVTDGIILYQSGAGTNWGGSIDGFSVSKLDKIDADTYAIRWYDSIYGKMEQIVHSSLPITFVDANPTMVFDRFHAANRQYPRLVLDASSTTILWNRIGWNNDYTGIYNHSFYPKLPVFKVGQLLT